jgi:hypothetical protein
LQPLLSLEAEFENDQKNAECANDTVGNNDRPKHECDTVNQPYNCTGGYYQHHHKAKVAGAFTFPGFVYLWQKGNR